MLNACLLSGAARRGRGRGNTIGSMRGQRVPYLDILGEENVVGYICYLDYPCLPIVSCSIFITLMMCIVCMEIQCTRLFVPRQSILCLCRGEISSTSYKDVRLGTSNLVGLTYHVDGIDLRGSERGCLASPDVLQQNNNCDVVVQQCGAHCGEVRANKAKCHQSEELAPENYTALTDCAGRLPVELEGNITMDGLPHDHIMRSMT